MFSLCARSYLQLRSRTIARPRLLAQLAHGEVAMWDVDFTLHVPAVTTLVLFAHCDQKHLSRGFSELSHRFPSTTGSENHCASVCFFVRGNEEFQSTCGGRWGGKIRPLN